MLIRLGGLAFGSSQFTFSMVVAVFVLCIALGSFAVSALPRIPAILLPAALWLPAAAAGGALRCGRHRAVLGARAALALSASSPESFYLFQLLAFLGVLLVLALPVALSGAVLPLMFHALRDRVGDLGDVAGRLYSWNTLGSLLGALIGGYALLFWLDLHHTYRIAMAAIAVAAVLMTIAALPDRTGRAGAAAGRNARGHRAAPRLAAGAALRRHLPQAQRARPTPSAAPRPSSAATAEAHAALLRRRPDRLGGGQGLRGPRRTANLAIVTNGKSDSAIPGDSVTTILLALIPALLAREPARAFVVGYGTGVTAGELAALEDVREVTVAEISPGVIAAAPLFDYGNLGASKNPKVHVVRGDAYRTLLRSQGRLRPDRLGAQQPVGDGHRDALQPRVPGGGARPPDTRRCPRAVVPQLRDRRRDARDRAAHLSVGVRARVGVVHGGNRPAADRGERSRGRVRPGAPAAPLRAARLPGGLRARQDHARFRPCSRTRSFPSTCSRRRRSRARSTRCCTRSSATAAARAFFTGGYGQLPVTSQRAPAEVGMRNSLLRRYAAAAGRPAQRDRARRASSRRPVAQAASQCAAMMARWIVDTPRSPVRDRMRSELAQNQMVMRSGRLDVADRLVWLYDDATRRHAGACHAGAGRAGEPALRGALSSCRAVLAPGPARAVAPLRGGSAASAGLLHGPHEPEADPRRSRRMIRLLVLLLTVLTGLAIPDGN